MINKIGFYPPSFKSLSSPQQKKSKPAESPREMTQKQLIDEINQLERKIKDINRQIFQLEMECTNAAKKNPMYDTIKTYQAIGRWGNRKVVLVARLMELREEIFNRLN